MEIDHLREVPGGWRIAVVREAGRWRVHEAMSDGRSGRARLPPPAPVGEGRFASMSSALEAAVEWLREDEAV